MNDIDFFLSRATRAIVPVTFSVGTHADDDGQVRENRHDMARVDDDKELRALVDVVVQAPAGKQGGEREEVQKEALFRVWDRLVVRVYGYSAAVDALEGPELREYFRGSTLPADLDPTTRARAVEGMALHVATAVWGYFDRLSPEPSFRRKRT